MKTVFWFHVEDGTNNMRLVIDENGVAKIEQKGVDALGSATWAPFTTPHVVDGLLASALSYAILFKVSPGDQVVVGRLSRGKLTIEQPAYIQLVHSDVVKK